jgi:hypothetical protein
MDGVGNVRFDGLFGRGFKKNTCRFRKSYPDVMVVQVSKPREPFRGFLCPSSVFGTAPSTEPGAPLRRWSVGHDAPSSCVVASPGPSLRRAAGRGAHNGVAAVRAKTIKRLELLAVSSRMAATPAQEEIDEPADKFLRPRSDIAHLELLA